MSGRSWRGGELERDGLGGQGRLLGALCWDHPLHHVSGRRAGSFLCWLLLWRALATVTTGDRSI